MSIGIFMEYRGLAIQFPVNPEELKVKTEGSNEVKEVVKLGEVNIARDKKLSTIEFESFLPEDNVYPFIRTKNQFKGPKYYIDFIERVRKDKKPVRFIVSDTYINLMVLIESFEYGYEHGTNDVTFTLSLKEFREVRVKEVKISNYASNRPSKNTNNNRKNSSGKVTRGCTVIVNGRLHRDSFGKGPGMTLRNYKGKINFIQNGRKYPYHVTEMNGGWMGWVTKESVRVV
ncbi:phage baseplate protein [Clostridium baratii]|uniref:phage baseplate protein n=1 Tax=Clostridium baratii TaxID=1561 RepID=UPI0030CEA9D3